MDTQVAHSATLYFSDIAKTIPIRDAKVERKLIRRWQRHKDLSARDELVQSHLRFVVTLARKRSRDPDRLPDLIAAGNMGLIKAVDKYDLRRKPATRFLTYAGWWIAKEIADEDYTTSSLVHVPIYRHKAQRRQAKLYQKALQSEGPDSPALRAMDRGYPEGVTTEISGLRESADEGAGNTSVTYSQHWSNHHLRRVIGRLPPREQTVLNLYFGTKDDPRNLVQIASILGMCPERVRQIKINGVRLLRDALEAQHITAPHDVY
jgi:RNA polymerase sigma factor (sigma-70 family)